MFGDLLAPWHLLIVLLIVLLVLGPKRVPGIGRALGTSLRQFRESVAGRDEAEEAPRSGPEPSDADPRATIGNGS